MSGTTAKRNHLSIYVSRESEITCERVRNRAAGHLLIELLGEDGREMMVGKKGEAFEC